MSVLYRDTFDDAMNWLVKFHNADISEIAKDQYYKSFRNVDDTQFSAAVNHWCEITTPQKTKFPAVHDLQKLVQETRDQEWERRKRNEPKFDQVLGRQRTEHGRRALTLMIDFMRRKLNLTQYIAGMRQMDSQFPGVGWKQAADELEPRPGI